MFLESHHAYSSTSVDTCISFSGRLMTTITSPVDWTDLSCIFMTFKSIKGGNFTQMDLMVMQASSEKSALSLYSPYPSSDILYSIRIVHLIVLIGSLLCKASALHHH